MTKRHVSQSALIFMFAMVVRVARVEAAAQPGSVTTTTNKPAPRLQAVYAQIPLSFEANQGQADEAVKFLARGSGYMLALTANGAVLARGSEKPQVARHKSEAQPLVPRSQSSTIQMQLIGSTANAGVLGMEELPGKVNYFVGKDSAHWRTNVPTYAKVKYEQVYAGIDLIYYGNQQQLEYDFIVQPGADPKRIRLSFAEAHGQASLQINEDGELLIGVDANEVRFHRPHIYQEVNGVKKEIAGRYVLTEEDGKKTNPQSPTPNPQIGFEVAAYDTTKPLIIDPTLSYSTYLERDAGAAIAVDSSGNAYVVGSTHAIDFPTSSEAVHRACVADKPTNCSDIFVAKFNAEGSALLYATYLGGSDVDDGASIAVDSGGNAYVTGGTLSSDFPITPKAFDRSCGSDGSCNGRTSDAFIAKLNATGTALLYATYLGGQNDEGGTGIAVDAAGNAYVTGSTWSPDFPTKNPFQLAAGGAECGVSVPLLDCIDTFVTKLNASGSALIYSSFLGGHRRDEGHAIAVDTEGNAYITGFTESSDFPVVNAAQSNFAGPLGQAFGDAFVVKVNVAGSGVVYSTYLGGSGWDNGRGIAVDLSGNAYITGWTGSVDFPVFNPFQAHRKGFFDAFLTKLNASGSAFLYSTYLGGANYDESNAIAVDSLGNAYITGDTYSNDFPTLRPLQARRSESNCPNTGGAAPCSDAFVTKFNADGKGLTYSTYLGGGGSLYTSDGGNGIAVDAAQNLYVTGGTGARDFPTENPFQISLGGGAFVAKIVDLQPSETVAYFESPDIGPASGIAVVRGWAFSTQPGIHISQVELFIDGRRANDIPGIVLGNIPCCSERRDVQVAFPQDPAENTLNSGWGATVNWNWLSAGPHSVRVKIRDTSGNLFFTESREVIVVKPGDFEFLDQFDLSQVAVAIQNQDLIVNGVVVRDKATQQQKTVNARFRWFTSSQSVGLVQAETVGTSSAQWTAPPFLAWFASLASRIPGWPLLASAQATSVIVPYFEDPGPDQIVSGIRIIRGWAFAEEPDARISTIRLTTDFDSQGSIPCCSGRGDVAVAFSGQANALNSGWGATFNYGNLSAGLHTIGVQIEDSTGAAVMLAHNVTIVRLGGFAFVDQFDLSNATTRIDGEEIVLSGVVVRDKESQRTKTIEVRLRWLESSQGLEIVAATE